MSKISLVRRACVLVAAATILSGCSTVLRGTNDDLQVITQPAGAVARMDSGEMCRSTPCSIKLKRRTQGRLTVSKPGCQPRTILIGNRISGEGGATMAGNIILGGPIGLGVDAISGAPWDLDPNPARIQLACAPGVI